MRKRHFCAWHMACTRPRDGRSAAAAKIRDLERYADAEAETEHPPERDVYRAELSARAHGSQGRPEHRAARDDRAFVLPAEGRRQEAGLELRDDRRRRGDVEGRRDV